MADKTLLIGGGIVAAGLLYFMSQGKGEETTLDDTQATSYVGISGDGTADNRTVDIKGVSDYLGDCVTPADDGSGSASGSDDGNTTCETPLWKANETIVLEHPLAATNSGFSTYKFTVKIVSDIMASATEAAFAAMPEGQIIGDYSISATRSGPVYESGRWTIDQNDTFANGVITKSNALTPASSVIPSWDEVLTAFGGYMPGKVGATGDDIILRQGHFDDVGQFQYIAKTSSAGGQEYPVSIGYAGVNKFALDMSGSVIPLYAQFQYKCATGGAWIDSGGAIQVTSANILGMAGDNADGSTCHKPCFPVTLPTSGAALGCTLPSVTISYPSKINVYCDERLVDGVSVQDCSNVPTSSAGGKSYTEWWNLNTNINTPTTMQKGGWNTPSGAVWAKIFDSWAVPRVISDAQGWYVYASSSNMTKHYLNSVLPGFKAAYTRQSVTCACPSDTNDNGTTFTIYDKSKCPEEEIVMGGTSDEWKTTYCGGLAPVVGCTDPKAKNYCSDCIDSTPAQKKCVLKQPNGSANLCQYEAGTLNSDCFQGGDGSGGGFGLGGGVQEYVDTSDNDDGDAAGVISVTPGVGSGFSLMAENTLNARNFINTGHSFLNW